MFKVIKLNDNVLVYNVDTPDEKMEFMDHIDAKPGDVFRFAYNGWLEYLGNDFDKASDRAMESADALALLHSIKE